MKTEKINALLYAGAAFVIYILLELVYAQVLSQVSLRLIIRALVTVLLFSWLQLRYKDVSQKKNLELSRLIYFIIFGFILTFAGQGIAYWILNTFEHTNTYLSLTGLDLIIYVLISTSLGAWAEELVFRWGMYHQLRKEFSVLFAFVLSTIFFILIHGTLMHIPVTLAVSILSCLIYELTGQFKFCVYTHCIFNLCSLILDLIIPKLPSIPILFISLYILALVGELYIYFSKKTKKF